MDDAADIRPVYDATVRSLMLPPSVEDERERALEALEKLEIPTVEKLNRGWRR